MYEYILFSEMKKQSHFDQIQNHKNANLFSFLPDAFKFSFIVFKISKVISII